MNQNKLNAVKVEMSRLNIDILEINELKWTGMTLSEEHHIFSSELCKKWSWDKEKQLSQFMRDCEKAGMRCLKIYFRRSNSVQMSEKWGESTSKRLFLNN